MRDENAIDDLVAKTVVRKCGVIFVSELHAELHSTSVYESLKSFPSELRALLATAPVSKLRQRASDGTFALIEQAWHLADLEAEGYGVRIQRMLEEDDPKLDDFRGDVVAEERRYLELELEPALRKFEEARARNVERVERLTEAERNRAGEQAGVGRVTIARVLEMMAEHDAGHAREVRALLEEILRADASQDDRRNAPVT